MVDTSIDKKTVLVPLTGHVRVALPSREERLAFITRLEQESEKMKAGKFTTFDKAAFIAEMLADYDRRSKQT